jgi:hypothetical protein
MASSRSGTSELRFEFQPSAQHPLPAFSPACCLRDRRRLFFRSVRQDIESRIGSLRGPPRFIAALLPEQAQLRERGSVGKAE